MPFMRLVCNGIKVFYPDKHGISINIFPSVQFSKIGMYGYNIEIKFLLWGVGVYFEYIRDV